MNGFIHTLRKRIEMETGRSLHGVNASMSTPHGGIASMGGIPSSWRQCLNGLGVPSPSRNCLKGEGIPSPWRQFLLVECIASPWRECLHGKVYPPKKHCLPRCHRSPLQGRKLRIQSQTPEKDAPAFVLDEATSQIRLPCEGSAGCVATQCRNAMSSSGVKCRRLVRGRPATCTAVGPRAKRG